MDADDLVMQVTKTSVTMVMSRFFWNILLLVAKGLKDIRKILNAVVWYIQPSNLTRKLQAIFFQNITLFPNAVYYKCNIYVCNWSSTLTVGTDGLVL